MIHIVSEEEKTKDVLLNWKKNSRIESMATKKRNKILKEWSKKIDAQSWATNGDNKHHFQYHDQNKFYANKWICRIVLEKCFF